MPCGPTTFFPTHTHTRTRIMDMQPQHLNNPVPNEDGGDLGNCHCRHEGEQGHGGSGSERMGGVAAGWQGWYPEANAAQTSVKQGTQAVVPPSHSGSRGPRDHMLTWAALDLWVLCCFTLADWVIKGEVVPGTPKVMGYQGCSLYTKLPAKSKAHPSRERHRNLSSYKGWGSPCIAHLYRCHGIKSKIVLILSNYGRDSQPSLAFLWQVCN